MHTKCGVTRSYFVVSYPCCGDVDIDQLETYGYRLKLDGGFCEGAFWLEDYGNCVHGE